MPITPESWLSFRNRLAGARTLVSQQSFMPDLSTGSLSEKQLFGLGLCVWPPYYFDQNGISEIIYSTGSCGDDRVYRFELHIQKHPQ